MGLAEIFLPYDLDGSSDPGLPMAPLHHLTKGALAEKPSQIIIDLIILGDVCPSFPDTKIFREDLEVFGVDDCLGEGEVTGPKRLPG